MDRQIADLPVMHAQMIGPIRCRPSAALLGFLTDAIAYGIVLIQVVNLAHGSAATGRPIPWQTPSLVWAQGVGYQLKQGLGKVR